MNKIDFVNDGQPAINDTNLNLMQANIESEINNKTYEETVLFTGNTNNDFSLNDSSANYDVLKIYPYVLLNNIQVNIAPIEVENANNKRFNLSATAYQRTSSGDSYILYYFANYLIDGANIKLSDPYGENVPCGRNRVKDSETWTPNFATTNYLYIRKVVGLKKYNNP